MGTWHSQRMTAFDLETTGVDPETARIVTATIVHVQGSVIDVRSWLVNPGIDIPAEATAVHGITTEEAQTNGVDPVIAVAQIFAELDEAWTGGHPVVIFNASYDLTVLDRELRRHTRTNLEGVIGPVIDPFVIDKHTDPYRKGKRTLTATCDHYQVSLAVAHDATQDALAAARLAWRLAELHPDELGDLAAVNGLQATWRAEWAKDFEAYLARQGKVETIDGNWPLRPAMAVSS